MRVEDDSARKTLHAGRANWESLSRCVVEKHGICWAAGEAGLMRLQRHSGKGFFTASAFLGGDSPAAQCARCGKLQADIRSAGLGFIQMLGAWTGRDEETGEEETAEELSLFVPCKAGYGVKEFSALAEKLALEYDQPGYILCDPESGESILYTGRELPTSREYAGTRLGPFRAEKLPEYYSGLRKGDRTHIQYVFEGVRVPSNHISAMAMSHRGHILLA